jgi:hypothetical protein
MIRRLLPFALLAPLASCVAAPALVPLGTNASTSPTQTLYRQAFVGRYSPSPICAGQELQVELAPESVYVGETGCNISRVDRTGGGVELTLTACRAEGAAQPDRTLRVTEAENGALRIDGGGVSSTVQPCFD